MRPDGRPYPSAENAEIQNLPNLPAFTVACCRLQGNFGISG